MPKYLVILPKYNHYDISLCHTIHDFASYLNMAKEKLNTTLQVKQTQNRAKCLFSRILAMGLVSAQTEPNR